MPPRPNGINTGCDKLFVPDVTCPHHSVWSHPGSGLSIGLFGSFWHVKAAGRHAKARSAGCILGATITALAERFRQKWTLLRLSFAAPQWIHQ